MAAEFLDTKVFVRYFARDELDHAARADILFAQVQAGDRVVTTCEAVIAEVVHVLSSPHLYHRSRAEIRGYLLQVLTLRGMELPNKRAYLRALELYASQNIDFVDALLVAHMERTGTSTVVSFDRDFDRIEGVIRVEP